MYVSVCVYVYVCMYYEYVGMCVCVYVCMYMYVLCMYIRTYLIRVCSVVQSDSRMDNKS